jgi:putative endonuclease
MDRIVRPAAASRKRAKENGNTNVNTSANPGSNAAGNAAEEIAANFLMRHKLKMLVRNYRVRGGEIDLICEEGKTIVFVEVRLRSSNKFGGAAASITYRKQQRLILAARHWLSQHGDAFGDRNCRFDCIVMDAPEESRLEWIKNAFSAD